LFVQSKMAGSWHAAGLEMAAMAAGGSQSIA
jgi:hypothetical protein